MRAFNQSMGVRLASAHDLAEFGWDSSKLLNEIKSLDYEVLDGLTQLHEGTAAQWVPVFMNHPDTWRVLVNRCHKIIGYWHFVPLADKAILRMRAGCLTDSEITAEDIRRLEKAESYDIYMVSICIVAHYRRTLIGRKLLTSFFDVASALARRGVLFKDIYANAYTAGGVSLCNRFGLEQVIKHADHGTIFAGRFSDVLKLNAARYYHELRIAYRLDARDPASSGAGQALPGNVNPDLRRAHALPPARWSGS